MHAPPDTAGRAYSRLAELARQGWKAGMILTDLRKEGFSEDAIVAAVKERLAVLDNHYRQWAARLFRVAAVLFALGVIAWPVTALFDFGALEDGALFGLFGACAIMLVRGAWTLLRARRFRISDDQVREFVSKGEIESSGAASGGALAQAQFADPGEDMEDALAQSRAIKRIHTAAWWSKATVAVVGGYLLLVAMSEDRWLAFVLGFAVYALAALVVVPIVAMRVAAWVEFGRVKPAASAAPRADSVKIAEVPRPDSLPIPTDDDVINSPPLPDLRPMATAAGGHAHTASADQPPGVIVFTGEGIAFFPNVDSPEKVASGIASSVLALASSVSPLVEAASDAGLADVFKVEEPALPLWLRQARDDKHHFVVPWIELVRVRYEPAIARVYLEREDGDGKRHDFVFASSSTEWPEALMGVRMSREVLSVLREHVELPRMREILPDLMQKFRSIYGDRLNEHLAEIAQEAERRVSEQKLGDALGVITRNMAKTLPHYGKYPHVRAKHPHFFG